MKNEINEVMLRAKSNFDKLVHESETIMQIVREHPELAPIYEKRMQETIHLMFSLIYFSGGEVINEK